MNLSNLDTPKSLLHLATMKRNHKVMENHKEAEYDFEQLRLFNRLRQLKDCNRLSSLPILRPYTVASTVIILEFFSN